MSTCDAGDGIFKSYLTNTSTEHYITKKSCYTQCGDTW